jgi:glycosyltransferase involved in cell wall biosynthesis
MLVLAHHLFGRTAFQQVALPIAAFTYGIELLIPSVYRSKRFIAVSQSTRDDLVHRGVDASRIEVIPNGLNHTLYHARGRVPAEVPTLLFVGRVEFYKRVDLILAALQRVRAQIPRVHLVIVGDGQARPGLERQVAALDLREHVSFTGFVSDAAKVGHIRSAHVVVNTSEKEGWGLTVLEANACGLPAIASDVAGLRDAVRDGVTGVLVPHADVGALSEAMLRLLKDTVYRERLAAGALAWAQQFSWQQSADDILRVVEEVAGVQ